MDQMIYFRMCVYWFDTFQNYLDCYKIVMGVDDKNKSTNLYVDGDRRNKV